jgi:2-polyprenyl-6-methoxyphenol hydroxylase-like FAD-dependent oxidoreductase
MKEVPVLIAGAGRVGMTLACELARRELDCMLVERSATTTRHPKMDITNARSMELFRRLGLVDALRRVAVPEDSNLVVDHHAEGSRAASLPLSERGRVAAPHARVQRRQHAGRAAHARLPGGDRAGAAARRAYTVL